MIYRCEWFPPDHKPKGPVSNWEGDKVNSGRRGRVGPGDCSLLGQGFRFYSPMLCGKLPAVDPESWVTGRCETALRWG